MLQHPLALVFLEYGQDYDEQHEKQQHQRIFDIAQQQINAACRNQQQKHRFVQYVGNHVPYPARLRRTQLVISGCGQALLRLCRA